MVSWTNRLLSLSNFILHTRRVIDINNNYLICRRFRDMVNFSKTDLNAYAIDLLPIQNAQLGSRVAFQPDTSTILCTAGTKTLCVVWLIGRVSRMWF